MRIECLFLLVGALGALSHVDVRSVQAAEPAEASLPSVVVRSSAGVGIGYVAPWHTYPLMLNWLGRPHRILLPSEHWISVGLRNPTNKQEWIYTLVFRAKSDTEYALIHEWPALYRRGDAQGERVLLGIDARAKAGIQVLREAAAKGQTVQSVAVSDLADVDVVKALGQVNVEALTVINLRGMEHLASLPSLRLVELPDELADLRSVPALPQVEALAVLETAGRGKSRTALTNLDGIEKWRGLRAISISSNQTLKDISGLRSLPALKSLTLTGCCKIESLQPLMELKSLEYVALPFDVDDAKLKALRQAGLLDRLRALSLEYCRDVKSLEPLRGLTQLRYLSLYECSDVESVDVLASLPNLQVLCLFDVEDIQTVEPLRGLRELQYLCLSGSSLLKDVKPLKDLSKLEVLDLSHCENLQTLEGLEAATSMTHLTMFDCKSLTGLGPLANMRKLEYLLLSCNEQVTDLTPLGDKPALRSLLLGQCAKVADLAPLARLSKLETLDLYECRKVSDLSPLKSLENLRGLNLEACSGVTDAQVEELRTALPNCKIAR